MARTIQTTIVHHTHTPIQTVMSRINHYSPELLNPETLGRSILELPATEEAVVDYRTAENTELEASLHPILVGDFTGIPMAEFNDELLGIARSTPQVAKRADALDLERPIGGVVGGLAAANLLTGVYLNTVTQWMNTLHANMPITTSKRFGGLLGKQVVSGTDVDMQNFSGRLDEDALATIRAINKNRAPSRERNLAMLSSSILSLQEGDVTEIIGSSKQKTIVNVLRQLADEQLTSGDDEVVSNGAPTVPVRSERLEGYRSVATADTSHQPVSSKRKRRKGNGSVATAKTELAAKSTDIEKSRDDTLRVSTPWMEEGETVGGHVYLGDDVEVHVADAVASRFEKDKDTIDDKVRTNGEGRRVYYMQIDTVARSLAQGASVINIPGAILFNKNKPNSSRDNTHPYAGLKIYITHQGAKNTARAIYTIRNAEPKHGRDKAYEVILLAVSDRRKQRALLTSITDMPKAEVAGKTMS